MTSRPTTPRFRSLAILALPAVLAPQASAQETAQYAFEFVAEWSAATHPTDFPPNPHFSPIVGATHTGAVSVWESGGIATPGIEQMAETGGTSILRAEILGMVVDGDADQYLSLGGVGLSPGVRTNSISADASFPLLSLVTMIAPSPDWFVGIHAVDLRPGGVWAREILVSLDAYDSGTDAGVSYRSGNSDIAPHIPIENISASFPFNDGGPIGTFRLTLTSDAACSLADIAEPYEVLDLSDISGFIAAFGAQEPPADIAAPFGVFDLADISGFVESFTAGCP